MIERESWAMTALTMEDEKRIEGIEIAFGDSKPGHERSCTTSSNFPAITTLRKFSAGSAQSDQGVRSSMSSASIHAIAISMA